MAKVLKTEEQIDKEKADKVSTATTIQPDKADIKTTEVNSTELGKSQPVDVTPPKESARQYGKKVGDYNRVVEIAKEKGVDLDNIGAMPLMDSDKGKITDAVKSAYGRELATGIQGISDAITAPQNEERSKLDVKKLMDDQKRIRRAKFSDSLYAFGEGLQGKSVDPEKFTTTRLVRQRDEEFQKFKDTTERNKKTKYLWEDKSRKEMIDWADQEAKNMQQSEEYRQKMQMLAEKYAEDKKKAEQDQKNKDRGYRIQEDRNNISRDKKEDKKIRVETSKKVHELTQEKYNNIKRDVLTNIDKYKDRYSNWFIEKPEMEETYPGSGVKAPTGKTTIELRPQIKEDELVGAYLEEQDNPLQPKVGSAAYFDNYRKKQGLPTSSIPVSETTKAAPRTQSKPQQAAKSDPLNF